MHRFEMLEQAFLGGLIVIGRHHQGGIGARLLSVPSEMNGLGRGIRSGSGNHGNPTRGCFDAEFDNSHMLLMRERRRLARGAARNEGLRAVLYLPVDKGLKCLFIDGFVAERGDQSSDRALEHGRGPL